MIDLRSFITALIVGGYGLAAVLIVIVLNLYNALPDVVALDFGPDGQPVIGPKERLLTSLTPIIGIGLGTALIITAIVLFRHTLVDRYPYLINLPALTLILGKIADKDVRRQYIDRLFVPVALVTYLDLVIIAASAIMVLEAARTFSFDATTFTGLLVILTGGFIAGMLLYYRSIYKQIKAMVT